MVPLRLAFTISALAVNAQHYTYDLHLRINAELPRYKRAKALAAAYSVRPSDDAERTLKGLGTLFSNSGLQLPLQDLFVEVARIRKKEFELHCARLGLNITSAQPDTQPPSTVLARSYIADATRLSPTPFSFHKLFGVEPSSRLIPFPDACNALVHHVRHAILNSRGGLSRLLAHPGVFGLNGSASSDAARHLLNNLASAPGTRYLEVGSRFGATTAAALAGNEYAVDLAVAVFEDKNTLRTPSSVEASGSDEVPVLELFKQNVQHHVEVCLEFFFGTIKNPSSWCIVMLSQFGVRWMESKSRN